MEDELGDTNTERHMPRPPMPAASGLMQKIVKWGVPILFGGIILYGWNAGWFEPLPTKCDDISAWRMNSVYENSLYGKMGLKILAVESIKDTGSNSAGLRCDAKVFTTHGEMDFTVTTRTINGTVYIEMQPKLF